MKKEEKSKIEKLLEENLETTREIREMTKYIKRYVIISQILGFVKLFLIAIPVALGIIYLPPFIEKIIQQYQNLLP
ncbi:MAG: hypothetical protein ACOCUF_01015 [Patescibacteria group bacterium]